jgi:hypothetical protein
MFQRDESNRMFTVAEDLVYNSSANVFLTGKAGTGKTTFLKHVYNTCKKNLAVVAPTGVAAINAGGTTIHSFFQLPFGCFNYNQSPFFLGKLKINAQRRQVFRQLELLIIDEISMVRADLLDAIDVVLKHFRYNYNEPFGGVQVLMIGDMYQLSPVVKDEEWALISGNYNSPYFFDSRVMQQSPPVHIAFTKIYRQQDDRFVTLLNKVRHNTLDQQSIQMLEQLYRPGYQPTGESKHIILTTHNHKADTINKSRLEELDGTAWKFSAAVEGEFNEKNYPTDAELELKVGARVMFIKNDTEKVRRYFNGKIGTVSDINNDEVYVRCEDSEPILVAKEIWKNIRYAINSKTQQIEEEEIGSFTQFPLRLAWAVTIHKSQGLTFDNVVIDAGGAFTPGQVYVALSRCTNMEGIIMLSRIPQQRLANDNRVVAFAGTEVPGEKVMDVVSEAKNKYQQALLLKVFDFAPLQKEMKDAVAQCDEHKKAFSEALWPALQSLEQKMSDLQEVGTKFHRYLHAQFASGIIPDQNQQLQQRLVGAVKHFSGGLLEVVNAIQELPAVTDSRQAAKEYNESFKTLSINLSLKRHLVTAFADGFSVSKYQEARNQFTAPSFSINAYAAAKANDRTAVPHPALYTQLKELRDSICNRTNAPVYLVASGKTLEELVTYLPKTVHDLRQVKGFGKVNTEKCGQQFVDIIVAYCSANQLETNMHQLAPKKEKKKRSEDIAGGKVPGWKVSVDLFKENKTVAEIAHQRNFAISTIEGHLATGVGHGAVDAYALVPAEKIEKILAAYTHTNGEGLNELMHRLGNGYSYFELKVAVQYKTMTEQTATEP